MAMVDAPVLQAMAYDKRLPMHGIRAVILASVPQTELESPSRPFTAAQARATPCFDNKEASYWNFLVASDTRLDA